MRSKNYSFFLDEIDWRKMMYVPDSQLRDDCEGVSDCEATRAIKEWLGQSKAL